MGLIAASGSDERGYPSKPGRMAYRTGTNGGGGMRSTCWATHTPLYKGDSLVYLHVHSGSVPVVRSWQDKTGGGLPHIAHRISRRSKANNPTIIATNERLMTPIRNEKWSRPAVLGSGRSGRHRTAGCLVVRVLQMHPGVWSTGALAVLNRCQVECYRSVETT
jgi:hypothetical protein